MLIRPPPFFLPSVLTVLQSRCDVTKAEKKKIIPSVGRREPGRDLPKQNGETQRARSDDAIRSLGFFFFSRDAPAENVYERAVVMVTRIHLWEEPVSRN